MGNLKHFEVILALISLLILFFVNKPIGFILLTAALIISIYNNSYIFKLTKANKLYNMKDYENSLTLYRELMSSKRVLPGGVINNYLIMELKYGEPEKADQFAAKLKYGSNFKSHDILSTNVTKSLIAWKCNRKDEAINNLKEYLKNGQNTYIYETLTSLLISAGEYNEALEIINEGLDYTDTSTVLKSNLAEAQYLIGFINDAEELFAELINSNVSFLEPYYYYGLILRKKGNLQEAADVLNKGLAYHDSLVSLISKAKIQEILDNINDTLAVPK